MSFLDRARHAAEQAVSRATSDESQARVQGAAKAAGLGLRGAAGQARRGMVTLVEKIDPGLLADVVIKATALQERTNDALREKRSAYRIGELTITATIPPQIGFAIVRIDDAELEELRAEIVDSTQLVNDAETLDSAVVSLEGDMEPDTAATEADAPDAAR